MQKLYSTADKISEGCLEAKGNIWKTEQHFQGYIPELISRKVKVIELHFYLFKEMSAHPHSPWSDSCDF